MENLDLTVLRALAQWRANGQDAVLATVVHTWGSSPRPIGCIMALRGDGMVMGSVSGGCIEGAVVMEAMDVIKSGKPKLLDFGVSDEQAWDVGLACGGKVQVYVEPVQ